MNSPTAGRPDWQRPMSTGSRPPATRAGRFVPVLALAEAALDGVDLAQPPVVGVGDQGQQLVALGRAELEGPDIGLARPQVGDALDDGAEVVALDAVARALVRVEVEVEQGAVEEAPAAVEGLGDEDRFGPALGEGVVEAPQVEGRFLRGAG